MTRLREGHPLLVGVHRAPHVSAARPPSIPRPRVPVAVTMTSAAADTELSLATLSLSSGGGGGGGDGVGGGDDTDAPGPGNSGLPLPAVGARVRCKAGGAYSRPLRRGLLPSTFQLNLSRVCDSQTDATQHIPQKVCKVEPNSGRLYAPAGGGSVTLPLPPPPPPRCEGCQRDVKGVFEGSKWCHGGVRGSGVRNGHNSSILLTFYKRTLRRDVSKLCRRAGWLDNKAYQRIEALARAMRMP